MTEAVLTVERAGGHVRMTINRPDRLNALNRQVFGELHEAVEAVEGSDDVRVVTIHGAGRAFCAGADVEELEVEPDELRSWLEDGQQLFARIAHLHVPTVAVVDGLALGGGFELALACDLVLASSRARLGLPEPTLGLIPGLGGTQRLPRAIAGPVARRILLTGEAIEADEAWQVGLLSAPPVAPDDLDSAVLALVERILGLSATAVRAIVEASRRWPDAGLTGGLAAETDLAVRAAGSDDGREGIRALLEKRPPQFKGNHA